MPSSQKLQILLKPNCTNLYLYTTLRILFRYEIQNGGLSLTLDPMGKMFQNASSLKPLGHKLATTAGHRLTLDPMGKLRLQNLCFLCRS